MKALVVDDDVTSRLILQQLLLAYGPCDIVRSGKEALAALQAAERDPYDLICLDIMMPEMDGHAVLKAIRASEKAMGRTPDKAARIIMTTALSDGENVVSAIREQCDAYLVKPIGKNKLHAELRGLGLVHGARS